MLDTNQHKSAFFHEVKNNKIDPYIFRAYDIRGIYKKNFDEDVMFKIGYVLGKKKESFVVGQDIRKSGAKLTKALIKGLIMSGAKVFYTGVTSFGQTSFAGWHYKIDKTLYITASHLPPEWNGLKLYYGDGAALLEKEIKKIRDEVIKIKNQKSKTQPQLAELGGVKNTNQKSKIKKINIKKEYSDYLLGKFPKLKNNKLKVVVDCGNGAMCLSAPQIFKKFRFDVSELYCDIDPSFPGRGGEPTRNKVKVLQQKVKKEKADFGVAFDGDGDRAVIIDDKGRYLSGNEVGVILAKNILRNSKRKNIIASVACSMSCERELEPLGAKIIRVPVGHTYLTILAKKYNAVFGMEESGHIVMPQYFLSEDALLLPLKIAEIILEKNEKLSELVAEIKTYPFEEINFICPDEKKFKVAEGLIKKISQRYKNVNTIDGVKVNFNHGWILIRVSNTSPIMRLYIEAINKEKLKQLKQKFSEIIKKEIKKLI